MKQIRNSKQVVYGERQLINSLSLLTTSRGHGSTRWVIRKYFLLTTGRHGIGWESDGRPDIILNRDESWLLIHQPESDSSTGARLLGVV